MFRKVLVPLDGSPLAEQAIPQATAIARASGGALDLVLVHQRIPIAGFEDLPLTAPPRLEESKYLAGLAEEVTSGAAVGVTHTTMEGDPAEMICRRAEDADVDLVVMTSHGRTGLSRAWLGSTADRVLRHSSVPVLMLHPVRSAIRARAARHLFTTVLVALDGSPAAEHILDPAVALAQCSDARVVLVRVVQPVPLLVPEGVAASMFPGAYGPVVQDTAATEKLAAQARTELSDTAKSLRARQIPCEAYVVVADHVARAILDAAGRHAAEAIAMATYGRGASRLVMGSITDKVLRTTDLPMLLLRPGAAGVQSDARRVELAQLATG